MLQCKKCNRAWALAFIVGSLAAAFQTAPLAAEARVAAGAGGGTWAGADAATGKIADVAGLEKLAAVFPDSASVQLRLLNAQLSAENMSAVLDTIAGLYRRGYRLSERAEQQLLGMMDGEWHARLAALAAEPRPAKPASKIIDFIPAEAQLVESLSYDPADDTLYATSVIGHDLFASKGPKNWHPLHLVGAAALTGIVFDPEGGIIWVASGDPGLGSEPLPGFRGLLGYDPAAGKVTKRIAAPDGSDPSDIARGPDGTLYVADPLAGVVYRASPDAKVLAVLVPAGIFRSPQGLAVSKDGRTLYVSDYRYGLARIDLASGRVDRLGGTGALFLDGIDALWLSDGALVGVQNGSRPKRIVRLGLSGDGKSIVSEDVLEEANPDWTEPLGGTIFGGQLLYIGNGQWDRFGEGGAPDPDNPPGPTQIRLLQLDD